LFSTRKSKIALLIMVVVSTATFHTRASAKAPPKRQPLISAVSKNVRAIDALSVNGVAAFGNVNGENVRGTFLPFVKAYGLGHEFGMVSGDILLMINNKVTESPEITKQLITEFSGVKSTVKFARQEGNVLVIHESPAFWVITTAGSDDMSSPGSDSMGSYGAVTHAPPVKVSPEELEDFMMQMVNNARTMNGNLPKLKKSTTLSNMARTYAEDMAKRNFFSHKNPEGLGMVERGAAVGVTNHIAENLSNNRSNLELREQVKQCQKMMMDEPANVPGNHRSNILDPETKSVGVGVAFPTKGGVITVQEFSHDDIP
jgi:uncharacterized protein YkwD